MNDARNYYPEFIRKLNSKDIHFDDDLLLKSVSIEPSVRESIIDNGKIIDQDGRYVSIIEALVADSKGNVFMAGS